MTDTAIYWPMPYRPALISPAGQLIPIAHLLIQRARFARQASAVLRQAQTETRMSTHMIAHQIGMPWRQAWNVLRCGIWPARDMASMSTIADLSLALDHEPSIAATPMWLAARLARLRRKMGCQHYDLRVTEAGLVRVYARPRLASAIGWSLRP